MAVVFTSSVWLDSFSLHLYVLKPELTDTADTSNQWMWASYPKFSQAGISPLALERGVIVALIPFLYRIYGQSLFSHWFFS